MKIGIIIIFHNNEKQINKSFLIKQINEAQTIELCLVDNESKDKTLQLLKDIKDACLSNVTVVEIKKQVSENAAKRAGSRYMFNQFNLRHIGFINVNAINEKDQYLNALIEIVSSNKDVIIDFNKKTIENQSIKPTLFKTVFSVVDYIKQINTSKKFNNLNPSV